MKIRKTKKMLLRYGRKFTNISILNISQNMPLPILHIFKTKNERAAEIDSLRASQPASNLSVCTTDTISSSAERDVSFFAGYLQTVCFSLSLYIYIYYIDIYLSFSLSAMLSLSHTHTLSFSLSDFLPLYISLSFSN